MLDLVGEYLAPPLLCGTLIFRLILGRGEEEEEEVQVALVGTLVCFWNVLSSPANKHTSPFVLLIGDRLLDVCRPQLVPVVFLFLFHLLSLGPPPPNPSISGGRV